MLFYEAYFLDNLNANRNEVFDLLTQFVKPQAKQVSKR